MAALNSSSVHYVSGWCGTRNHVKCAGSYAGTDCNCQCHAQAALAAPVGTGTTLPAAELAHSTAA